MKSLFAASRLRFYWRECENMRHFRLTNDRPDHLAPWRWRLLEYRFAWALAKRLVTTK